MRPIRPGTPAAIVVVGSANADLGMCVHRIPRVGETVIGGTFRVMGGGKGANQAVAAAKSGGAVVFVSRIGRDAFAAKIERGLIDSGIDISHVTRDVNAPSGVAIILTGKNGENSIAVASGANLRISAADVMEAKPRFRRGGILLVQLEVPLPVVLRAIDVARKSDMRVILNPAPALKLPGSVWRKIDILTPNEHEAEALTGIRVDTEKSARRAANELRRRGVKTVILTLGARGVLVAERQGSTFFPAFKVKAIDTTGAGDVFNGSLAAALAEGRELSEAINFGQAAAALSVMRIGAQASAPRRAEIEKFLLSRKRKI